MADLITALDARSEYHNLLCRVRYLGCRVSKDNLRLGDVVMSYQGILYRAVMHPEHELHLRRMFTVHHENYPMARIGTDMLSSSLTKFYHVAADDVVKFANIARCWQWLTKTSIFSSAVFVWRSRDGK